MHGDTIENQRCFSRKTRSIKSLIVNDNDKLQPMECNLNKSNTTNMNHNIPTNINNNYNCNSNNRFSNKYETKKLKRSTLNQDSINVLDANVIVSVINLLLNLMVIISRMKLMTKMYLIVNF